MIRVRSHIRRAPSPTTRCTCASSCHTAEHASPNGRSRSPRVSGTLWGAFREMSGIGFVYFVDPPGLNSKSINLPVVDPFSGSAAVGAALSNLPTPRVRRVGRIEDRSPNKTYLRVRYQVRSWGGGLGALGVPRGVVGGSIRSGNRGWRDFVFGRPALWPTPQLDFGRNELPPLGESAEKSYCDGYMAAGPLVGLPRCGCFVGFGGGRP